MICCTITNHRLILCFLLFIRIIFLIGQNLFKVCLISFNWAAVYFLVMRAHGLRFITRVHGFCTLLLVCTLVSNPPYSISNTNSLLSQPNSISTWVGSDKVISREGEGGSWQNVDLQFSQPLVYILHQNFTKNLHLQNLLTKLDKFGYIYNLQWKTMAIFNLK